MRWSVPRAGELPIRDYWNIYEDKFFLCTARSEMPISFSFSVSINARHGFMSIKKGVCYPEAIRNLYCDTNMVNFAFKHGSRILRCQCVYFG